MNNAFTNKSLLTLLFNANGLKNHVNELQTVLYDKRIDLALITETQLSNTHTFTFQVTNYLKQITQTTRLMVA